MLHGEFAMEVLVLHPEVVDTTYKQNGYNYLTSQVVELLHRFTTLAISTIRDSQDDKEQCQQIIRYIIGGMLLSNIE